MAPASLAKKAGLVVLVAITVVALYWSGLSGGFFFDDNANVVQVESLHVEQLSIQSLQAAWQSGRAGPLGRPIAQVSFALNHYFSGFDPYDFKLTNLAIHLMTGVLVFLVARRLIPSLWLAGVATVFWLVHPIQLTSVLYVVQRMTSLSALFLLAAFLLHISGRERASRLGWAMVLAAWGLCWPLSMLSKENGALFPLFVAAWELIMRRAATGQLDRFAKLLTAMTALVVVAGTVYFFSSAGQWLWAGYVLRDFSPLERILTEARVLWFYLGLVFLPSLPAFGLQHDDIALSTSLLTPWTTSPALLGLVALMLLAWRSRERFSLVAFGIVWFFIGHALESTLLPLEIAHEHRNYLPVLGLLLAVVGLVAPLAEQSGWRKTLVRGSIAAALGYCALLTGLRAHQFGDELRRTQIEVMHHPQSSRAHYEAGRSLAAIAVHTPADDPSRFFAASHYEQAAELNRNAKLPLLGLIHLNCSASLPIKLEWLTNLKQRLRETPFSPGDRTVLNSVKEMSIAGTLCLERDAVESLFSAALANPTASAHVRSIVYSWLADYRALAARDIFAAVAALDQSLLIAPHNPSNRLKRAQLAYLQQQKGQAEKMLAGIPDNQLLPSERETKKLLQQCIGGGNAVCVGM